MPAYSVPGTVPDAGVIDEQNQQSVYFSGGQGRPTTNHTHNKFLKYIEGWSVINATENHNRTKKRQGRNYNEVVEIGITEKVTGE